MTHHRCDWDPSFSKIYSVPSRTSDRCGCISGITIRVVRKNSLYEVNASLELSLELSLRDEVVKL